MVRGLQTALARLVDRRSTALARLVDRQERRVS
jgi:hypothetical protein